MAKQKKKDEPLLFPELEAEIERLERELSGDAAAARYRFELAKAVAEACGIDLEMTPRKGCGVIWDAAKELWEINVRPEDVKPTRDRMVKDNKRLTTPSCIPKWWSTYYRKEKPSYMTCKPDPAAERRRSDEEATAARLARAERVRSLPYDEYLRLRQEVLDRERERCPMYFEFLKKDEHKRGNKHEHQLNYEICRLIDEEGGDV